MLKKVYVSEVKTELWGGGGEIRNRSCKYEIHRVIPSSNFTRENTKIKDLTQTESTAEATKYISVENNM
jgi:hypothetical protein